MHAPQYRPCPYCQAPVDMNASHCSHCGQMFRGQAAPQYVTPGYAPMASDQASMKLPAGLCGILLGSLGVHKFLMGYVTEGIIMLACSTLGGLLTCGILTAIMHVIGLVEGIIYLTKSDAEFVNSYVVRRQGWF